MSTTQNNTQNLNSSLPSQERRMHLQNLYRETNNIENKSVNTLEMIEMTSDIIKQVDYLFKDGDIEERVRNPGESFLDSQVMKASSEIIVRCSQAISSEVNKYDKFELSDHIKRNHDFWEFSFPLEAPPVAYLYGTFAPTPRSPRAPRARAPRAVQKQQAAPVKVPQRTTNVAAQDETPKIVEKMYYELKQVSKDDPMSYFQAVLDPTSFSRSVENIYHLSFMAREGKLAVFVDEKSGLPFIKTLSNHKRRRLENSTEKQFIISITMELWKDLIAAFDIREPFFKTVYE